MNSDLVRSAGFEAAFHKSGIPKDSQAPPICHRVLAAAALYDRDLLTARRRTGEWGVDLAFGRLGHSGHDRQIATFNGMSGELLCEALVRDIRFRDHEQSRRVLVDPVNDSGPRNSANSRQLARAMVEQRVHQRSVQVSRSGVNDQTRGLVDNQ